MADSNALAGQELAGKVAIVTGAGRNIGRAIARQLAAAGASVVVNARSNQAEAAAAVEAMAQAALKRFGRIDILVNNASLRREKPIGEMSYADWREVMNATLDSASVSYTHLTLPTNREV